MSTFIFILVIAGIAYLFFFNKPDNISAEDVTKWFSKQLAEIHDELEKDIIKDQKGEYPHAGKQSFKPKGMITYILANKKYARFDISELNEVSMLDIMSTEGYKQLDKKVGELDLSIRLKEHHIEGDEVDDDFSLDEYIPETHRYYTVTIGGWDIDNNPPQ